MGRFPGVVSELDELQRIVGVPSELAVRKQLSALDSHMREFLAESPFALLGTYGRDGSCDVSPRGDREKLVAVLDDRTLLMPDRRGNRRVDSLRNIVETGRVGLLFLIPGRGETLRVNGRACVTTDEELLAPLAVEGKLPVLGIGVEIEECFFQCAKAILRSGLWVPRADEPEGRACFARILLDQTRMENETVEGLEQQIQESYREKLY